MSSVVQSFSRPNVRPADFSLRSKRLRSTATRLTRRPSPPPKGKERVRSYTMGCPPQWTDGRTGGQADGGQTTAAIARAFDAIASPVDAIASAFRAIASAFCAIASPSSAIASPFSPIPSPFDAIASPFDAIAPACDRCGSTRGAGAIAPNEIGPPRIESRRHATR